MTEAHTEVPTLYPPSEEFARSANATAELYEQADADRLAFWAEQAERLLGHPFTEVLDWSQAPVAKWFVGGKLNVSYNCVDRHVERATATGSRSTGRVNRSVTNAPSPMPNSGRGLQAANALTDLGLVAGDRVAIYMPMVPEVIVAMLACARLGIMHSVVFGGFSARHLRARIDDAKPSW